MLRESSPYQRVAYTNGAVIRLTNYSSVKDQMLTSDTVGIANVDTVGIANGDTNGNANTFVLSY